MDKNRKKIKKKKIKIEEYRNVDVGQLVANLRPI